MALPQGAPTEADAKAREEEAKRAAEEEERRAAAERAERFHDVPWEWYMEDPKSPAAIDLVYLNRNVAVEPFGVYKNVAGDPTPPPTLQAVIVGLYAQTPYEFVVQALSTEGDGARSKKT